MKISWKVSWSRPWYLSFFVYLRVSLQLKLRQALLKKAIIRNLATHPRDSLQSLFSPLFSWRTSRSCTIGYVRNGTTMKWHHPKQSNQTPKWLAALGHTAAAGGPNKNDQCSWPSSRGRPPHPHQLLFISLRRSHTQIHAIGRADFADFHDCSQNSNPINHLATGSYLFKRILTIVTT
jgi:hypothetical protein